MNEKKYKFETLEEYREYQRANAKKWYQENREKKIAYQKEYYKRKKEARENSSNE